MTRSPKTGPESDLILAYFEEGEELEVDPAFPSRWVTRTLDENDPDGNTIELYDDRGAVD